MKRLSELTRAFHCPLTKTLPRRRCPSCPAVWAIPACCCCFPTEVGNFPPHLSHCCRGGGTSSRALLSPQTTSLGRAGGDLGATGSPTTFSSKYPETPKPSSAFSPQKVPFLNPGETKDRAVFSTPYLFTQVISYLNSISALLIPAFHYICPEAKGT